MAPRFVNPWTIPAILVLGCSGVRAGEATTQPSVPLQIGTCVNIVLTRPGDGPPPSMRVCYRDGESVIVERDGLNPKMSVTLRTSGSDGDGVSAASGADTGLWSQMTSVIGNVQVSGANASVNRVGAGVDCPSRTFIYDRVQSGSTDVLVIDKVGR